MADIDDLDPEEPLTPRTWRRPPRTRLPAFSALHGAYHVVNRRMTLELGDDGLSASEAVVLEALRRHPLATIATIRQATGLRASTLDSLIDRLVARDVLQRGSPRDLRREVILVAAPAARLMTEYASGALRAIDEELAVFASREALGSLDIVFEAARALGVPGTAADF